MVQVVLFDQDAGISTGLVNSVREAAALGQISSVLPANAGKPENLSRCFPLCRARYILQYAFQPVSEGRLRTQRCAVGAPSPW